MLLCLWRQGQRATSSVSLSALTQCLLVHTSCGRYDEPCIAVTSDAALCCSGVCCGKLAQRCLLPTWCLPARCSCKVLIWAASPSRLPAYMFCCCSSCFGTLPSAWACLLSLLKVVCFKWNSFTPLEARPVSYFKCGLACTDTVSAGAHLFLEI